MPDFLTLHTEEAAHSFPCPPQAVLVLGSSEGCDLAFDGDDIAPRHMEIRRLEDTRFQLRSLSAAHRLNVNGVTAAELEVETPFRLRLGGDVIDFALATEAPKVSTTSPGTRRRDYMLGGSARARQRSAPAPVPAPESAHEPEPALIAAPVVVPPPFPSPPPPPVNHVRVLQPVSDPSKAAPVTVPKPSEGWWVVGVLAGFMAPAAIYFGYPFLFLNPMVPISEAPKPKAIEVPTPQPVVKPTVPPVPAARTDTYREDALAAAKAFLDSWSENDASGVLRFVSPAPANYFEMPNPASEAVLRLEEAFRDHWPQRAIRADGSPEASRASESRYEITQRYLFDLHGLNQRHAAGSGTLFVTLEHVAPKTWLVTRAADKIELQTTEPSREAFSPATSLRDLKPVLSEEERMLKAKDDLAMLVKAGDAKATLAAILENAAKNPNQTYWRFATDQICDALSRALFATGEWPDPTCLTEVQKLCEMGVPSAMLLQGHLLRAGYLLPRNIAEGEVLYRKAYETTKSREARFYYAEALFIGGEHQRASAIALATMVGSKHPLEAYLAAHLLWKKAELDPSLWQQVYEIAARAATQHPPAKNLAGLVLLKHGQTTKERQAGFTLIQKAAVEGVTEAMKNLSACYEYGDGCERNEAEADAWKKKAASTPPHPKRHYSDFE
jgi:TPR repeat protein